jgi:TonB family protein
MRIPAAILSLLLTSALFSALGEPSAQVVTKADTLVTVRPQSPYEARSRHITGSGVCHLTVRPDGRVEHAEMHPSTGSRVLDEAALDAFRKWRFVPGRVHKVKIPVSFSSRGVTLGDLEVIHYEKRDDVTYTVWNNWSRPDAGQIVDVPPEPKGGMKAFVSRLDYPASMRLQRVTGTVLVQVSLDSAGHVLSADIHKSLNPTLDNIVLRAVHKAPWTPAMKGGKSVPYKFKFPVTFRL